MQDTLGILAVAIGVVGYIPYIRNMILGRTKPHPFTWLGIGLLNGITFVAQIISGGGAGSWVSGITAVFTFGIALFSINSKMIQIKTVDWVCLIGSLVAIIIWRTTNNPLGAVVVVTVADILIMIPTFIKSYLKPWEETASLYLLSLCKYIISIFALSNLNLTTVLFPSVIAALNFLLFIIILLRRNQKAREVIPDFLKLHTRKPNSV